MRMTPAVILIGVLSLLATIALTMVYWPYVQQDKTPSDIFRPRATAEEAGRKIYIANGCVYCHTQQPRDRKVGPDFERGWGRPSVPADYVYDKPHLLGSMRTGPDLFNIGARQPSKDWHLGHLYQPRAYVPGSIMPAYPYLFDVKDAAEADEEVVTLPPEHRPAGGKLWSEL